jgi:hypothetical protein
MAAQTFFMSASDFMVFMPRVREETSHHLGLVESTGKHCACQYSGS